MTIMRLKVKEKWRVVSSKRKREQYLNLHLRRAMDTCSVMVQEEPVETVAGESEKGSPNCSSNP
jgi:hypothetical protein